MRTWRFVLALAVTAIVSVSAAEAQTIDTRYEIGGQATVLRLSDLDSTPAGIGGRFSFNVARWAAIEAEGNFFPQDDVVLPFGSPDLRITHFRKRSDFFVGAKLGYRGDRFGLFAKVRPGMTVLSQRSEIGSCNGDMCALVLVVRPEYRSEFAVDLGGIFEFYPSRRLVARFELGDTIIRHRSVAPPCWGEECTSNNVTTKFGLGFRF